MLKGRARGSEIQRRFENSHRCSSASHPEKQFKSSIQSDYMNKSVFQYEKRDRDE